MAYLHRAERLLRNAESVAYWLAVAPLASRLPARLAYRAACWRGDWGFRHRAGQRAEIVRNLRQVLGDEVSPEEAERLAREFFRMRSCEVIDVMLLRGRAGSLGKLVEIRGREHLEAALAGGKGAILCSAHFGSYNSAFSLIHASGFPLTSTGRALSTQMPGMSSAERRLLEFAYIKRLQRHRQRPGIEFQPGRVQVAAQIAVALRANEVVTFSSDAPPLEADRARAVEVTFLGGQVRLLPGVVPPSSWFSCTGWPTTATRCWTSRRRCRWKATRRRRSGAAWPRWTPPSGQAPPSGSTGPAPMTSPPPGSSPRLRRPGRPPSMPSPPTGSPRRSWRTAA